MPPPGPVAADAQAPAVAQRASSIASTRPIQAEVPAVAVAVAVAAVAWQPGRGILAVYPAGTAVEELEQRKPENE